MTQRKRTEPGHARTAAHSPASPQEEGGRRPGLWREPLPSDADYLRWRAEYLHQLDEDYAQWCRERSQRFSDEFEQWRRRRIDAAPSSAAGQVAAAPGGLGSAALEDESFAPEPVRGEELEPPATPLRH